MANSNFLLSPYHQQTAVDFMEGRQYLAIAIDLFLTNCKARNLSKHTINFYKDYLTSFAKYAEAQSISNVQDIDPNFIRSYILMFSKEHNPGGVHAAFRSIRAFLFWVEKEEIMSTDWKNPIRKVDAPRVPERIIEPVPLEDVNSLLATCHRNTFFDKRDKAIIFLLLDTGARAQEVCDINLEDVEMNSGQIINAKEKDGNHVMFTYLKQQSRQFERIYELAKIYKYQPYSCQRL